MKKLNELIRSDLREFIPYSSARDEAVNGNVWLNANESPFTSDFDDDLLLNRYPDKQPAGLISEISKLYDVGKNNIVLTRGSDEAIDLLIRLFCAARQDSILICSPTYGMYEISAKIQGAGVIDIPLSKTNGYQLDIPAIINTWHNNVKIIFLCSPNNPTGNSLKTVDILNLCKLMKDKCIIVVDEAYIEFSEADSFSSYIEQTPNLAILRTLSKAYGLASIRLGCLLGQEWLINMILKILAPYPLSKPVIKTAMRALKPERINQVKLDIKETKIQREFLTKELSKVSCVNYIYPSVANFILVEMTSGKNVMRECLEQGIVVRDMSNKPGLNNCLRITVGSNLENLRLINFLKNVSTI